jgi:hypothetical protein
MDAFETAFKAILTGLSSVDDAVVTATYTPSTGAPVQVLGHFDKESFGGPERFEFQRTQTEKTFEALLEDFGQMPDHGETITIDAVDYEIQEISFTDGKTIKAILR